MFEYTKRAIGKWFLQASQICSSPIDIKASQKMKSTSNNLASQKIASVKLEVASQKLHSPKLAEASPLRKSTSIGRASQRVESVKMEGAFKKLKSLSREQLLSEIKRVRDKAFDTGEEPTDPYEAFLWEAFLSSSAVEHAVEVVIKKLRLHR